MKKSLAFSSKGDIFIHMNKIEAVSFLLKNSLNFRVELSLDEMFHVLNQFERYNGIPNYIAEIADDIAEEIGPIKFAGDNPNNGRFDNIKFFIGNESSLVIYVEVIHAYQKRDFREYKPILGSIGRVFKADQITVTEEMGRTVARFWWD